MFVGGTALAVNHASSASDVIKACVNPKTRVLTVPRAGHGCSAAATPIRWNKIGPRGPRGQTGPAGPVLLVAGGVSAACKKTLPGDGFTVESPPPGSTSTCLMNFPENLATDGKMGDPLAIIMPLTAGVSVTDEWTVCNASNPGSCTVGYTLSSPSQILFTAALIGGRV